MTTNANNTTTIRIDGELSRFLRRVRAGQCLGLAAWAAKLLRRGEISEPDLTRCFTLGFEG